ncbi:MAG: GNAT family N-acetyltransferase [Thermoplasmata archaeon]
MDPPRPATSASSDDLLELFQAIRRELKLREEVPSGEWVERSAQEAKAGSRPAWYYPPSQDGGGLAVYTRRESKAWAHVHSSAGPVAEERALLLGTALLDSLPAEVRSVALGFSGFDLEQERRVAHSLAGKYGAQVVERHQMARRLRPDPPVAVPPLPAGVRLLPVRDATLEALADLDARAFQGTVDDLVVGGSVAHYADMMRGLLDSQMGRFLDEASTLLLQPDPLRLVGGVLCAETSPREAVIQDLMVEPERRGHGEGRFLLRWGLRALHALGYATATLWVTEANRSALRLYETEGFLRTASTVIFHWGRPDGVPQPQTSR